MPQRRLRRLLAFCWCLCLVTVAVAVGSATEEVADVRFHVPFAVATIDGLDLESRAVTPPDLRVKRTLAATDAACDAPNDKLYASIAPGDRLVAADGITISLQSFDQVIDSPMGTTVMLPLFTSGRGDGNILSGFARVEIVRPQTLEFQPTTAARIAAIEQWRAAIAQAQQDKLRLEQEARERAAAAENDALEREAQAQRERDEQSRLELTPHDHVAAKRATGREFRYEVEFTTRGPIGLNWDLHVTDQTVVSYVEPKLAAERVGVIAPKDQLIHLNDVDTSAMGPADVVQAYVVLAPPRRLVFRCPAKVAKTEAPTEAKAQNWTMVFETPAILQGWEPRLHLATWSREPTALVGTNMTLVAATPMTACQPLADVAGSPTVYLSYRGGCSFVDKAEHAIKSHAKAVVVVNNLKGLGRFPSKMPDVGDVDMPVTMISKLDGELLMAVLEYEPHDVTFRFRPEDPSVARAFEMPPVPAPKLSNEEMTFRRNPAKAARALTFWSVNTTSHRRELDEFRVLPALFGANVSTAPFRIVMAYPQDTACHPQGLGVLATQSVLLVKRGGCSFGMKAKSVQAVGGAGMIMINSDESLMALMSDPKETADLTIWAASMGLSNGTFLEQRLAHNKNLASFVKIS